jgi:hypothetical protein
MKASGAIDSNLSYSNYTEARKYTDDQSANKAVTLANMISSGINEKQETPTNDEYTVWGIPPGKVSSAGFNDAKDKWFNLTIDGHLDKQVETGNIYPNTSEFDEIYKTTTGSGAGTGSVLYDSTNADGMLYIRGSKWYEVLNQGANLDSADRPDNLRNKAKNLKPAKAYETGGLADYTGPAWLDGTKSHPELVLNARDTENFI